MLSISRLKSRSTAIPKFSYSSRSKDFNKVEKSNAFSLTINIRKGKSSIFGKNKK